LPGDPALHAAAYAYLSDYGSLAAVQRCFGDAFVWEKSTSLDHALWLHRSGPWSDWMLLDSRSDLGHADRAFTERRICACDGHRIATIGQEGLFGLRGISSLR